jgi:hypothetical protein
LPWWNLNGLRSRSGEQIELLCRRLARHGHLPDSYRESPMLRQVTRNCDGGSVSWRSLANASKTARLTRGAVVICQLALTARSNIHPGTSSHRSDARPERLQRKMAASPLSITSWT